MMNLKFYTNILSLASRKVGGWFFIIGLLLIGFGFLIWVLRELFALLFAAFFASLGVACIVMSIRIFWSRRRLQKHIMDDSELGYRKNVRIHVEEGHYQ
jgi:hypothetical protein